MSDHVVYLDTMRLIMGTSSAITNHKNLMTLKRIKIYILEMEDVLFHLNSAVMMPENPEGKSSGDSGGGSSSQEKVSGLSALALVFKQFEFDPKKRMIIAGHTDTSGQPKDNFDLSKERAENILYLLTGDKVKWAEICANRHKIEDYQQIMKFFAEKNGINCDPIKIDNKWGDKTENATKEFLKKTIPDKADTLLNEIKADSKKKWPEEVWQAVYDLYIKHLCKILGVPNEEQLKKRRDTLKYVNDSMPYVSCGESFPIDSKDKKNYRSQKNRRVEILFFDKDEIEAESIKCPPARTTVHKEEECPLWKKIYFLPLYIDPKDLTSTVYHLKFVYNDRIKNKTLPVPKGLTINAYKDDTTQISTVTAYENGIYKVKVQFDKSETSDTLRDFHFRFETDSFYVFTKDNASGTQPVIKKEADILTEKSISKMEELAFTEQLKHYDLPKKWSSKNYWTRYDGDMNKGDTFEKVMKDKAKLKPFDQNITKPDKPLIFSLDDIVLADSTKSQVIKDKNSSGNPIPLDDNSRYTLFKIDYDTKENVGGTQKNLRRIKIYKEESTQKFFTDFKFKKNIIYDVPVHTRIVYFCNDFYNVTNKRSSSSDSGFDYSKGHIAGARLAQKNDSTVHHFQDFQASNASDKTNGYGYNGTFHFELHYFHNCAELDNKPLHYLFIYWSCRLEKDSANGGTDNDVKNHREKGMINAMNRLNKDYLFAKSSGSEDALIRPFHFMEAKSATNGGAHKHLVKITDNNHGSWNAPTDASYRSACYQPEPGGWGGGQPELDLIKDTDDKTYIPLANHHEMGHATGCFDDYLYSLKINNDTGAQKSLFIPRFSPQHIEGGPYSCDTIARMKTNRSSRLRNYWKYICWLHDMSKPAQGVNPKGPLFDLLKGTKFKILFNGKKGGTNFQHQFELTDTYKNISKHAEKKDGYELVTNEGTGNEKKSKVDLLLYKLGDDQLSHFKNPGKLGDGYETTQVYYGILVVKIKFAVKFNGGWNFNSKKRWLQKLDDDLKSMLNAKFYLQCNNNDFKKVYLFFVPHFNVYTGAAPGDSNLNVTVSWTAGTTFNRPNISTVTMDRGSNGNQQDNQIKRLIRCSLAHSHGNSDTGNLTKTGFPKIAAWLKSKLANVNVEIKDI